jgi:16S rRNA (cytosine1402-N4)-methyltransferase
MPSHQPVLYQEIIHFLQPAGGGRYVDGTVGAGGHARGILEACAPDGMLLGLDVDQHALELARKTLAPYEGRFILVQASYSTVAEHLPAVRWLSVDGILLDLGASSMQFDDPTRGFSFLQDGPLDMRFTKTAELTAATLVNTLPEKELADILFHYGEERLSRRIARAIVRSRPLYSTHELVTAITAVTPRRGKIHPATRTFQALRIAVNDELTTLRSTLPEIIKVLKPGGRLAIISFHSLEDRIVKEFIRSKSKALKNPPFEQIYEQESEPALKEITRKPVQPSDVEVENNPRARSAKLRVMEKI